MEPNQQQTIVDDEYSTGEQTINNLFNLSTRVCKLILLNFMKMIFICCFFL